MSRWQSTGERTSITSTETQDDLANVDTGNRSVRLSPGTTHTSLQSIGTGTRQHLVDTDDVEWVDTDTQMEGLLSAGLDHVPDVMLASILVCFPDVILILILLAHAACVIEGHSLVGANTSGLKSLGTQLFILVGNQVDAERELVDVCTLAAEIEDANLGVCENL